MGWSRTLQEVTNDVTFYGGGKEIAHSQGRFPRADEREGNKK